MHGITAETVQYAAKEYFQPPNSQLEEPVVRASMVVAFGAEDYCQVLMLFVPLLYLSAWPTSQDCCVDKKDNSPVCNAFQNGNGLRNWKVAFRNDKL